MLVNGIEYDTRHAFYKSKAWQETRARVLRMDHGECQRCRHVHHRYTPATTVHHVIHLEKRPEYGLSIWVNGQRNLVSLCAACHNEVHPEKAWAKKKAPVTQERW